MTFLASPNGYTADHFRTHVRALTWAKGWKPHFIVLHNTSEPNLAQWLHGPSESQRIMNLNHYYKTLGWHSGPHLFISPSLIWEACDLEADGVHASCFNHVSIGIEMVGDYNTEAFDSGDGAKVRDLTVQALAVLHEALDLDPSAYAYGKSGVHFHRECVRDHHDCPGKNVNKGDMVSRIKAAMGALK